MKPIRVWTVALVLAVMLALVPAGHVGFVRESVPASCGEDTGKGGRLYFYESIAWAGTYPVTNTTDSGVGSLRQAILDANANGGDDTIEFDIPPEDPNCNAAGVCTIQPLTFTLPTLTDDGTTMDGYSQPGALTATATTSATLKIEIDGTKTTVGGMGLFITSARNVIRGLVINRFSADGVYIYGSGAVSNTISGNYIGTDADGTADLGNGVNGVYIFDGPQENTIGGDSPAERNVISGNGERGIYINKSGTTSNTVSGNYIGTDANGMADLGNGWHGVHISGAENNTVGGDTEGERNVISGNDKNGVHISAAGSTVSANYIGTDANGTADLGNTQNGVYLWAAENSTIGGDTEGERNVISDNQYGVIIGGSGATTNTVSANYIGTDANGTADLGNTFDGVYISDGAHNNTVGGDTPGERNVISGNNGHGVRIVSSGTTTNTVSSNYIGIAANGTDDLGNTKRGVYIYLGARNNTIGPDNVIAHNGQHGVEVNGSSTTGNTVTQNSIFSNSLGIDLTDGANGNIAAPVIVTTTLGSVNVVGTACAGCTVEVFENGDTDGEGETYVGDTAATASGAFTVTVSTLSKPYLTATASDVVSGTSEFSAVFTSTVTSVYLPTILKFYGTS